MKVIRLISAMLLIACTPLSAQYAGNVLHVELGGGLHTMTFNPQNAQKKAGGGVNVRAEYRRFFNRKVGIGVGVGFVTYRSSALLDDTETDKWEANGTSMQSRNDYSVWKEQQSLFNVSVPVCFYLQHVIDKRWSMLWGIGPQLNIPVNNEYTACEGQVTRTIGKETTVEEAPHTLRRIESKPVAVTLGTDLGFHFGNQGSLPLYFGVYLEYGITSFLKDSSLPLYAASYNGLFRSHRVSTAHTLAVGFKVGFSLNFSKTCTGGRCGFY